MASQPAKRTKKGTGERTLVRKRPRRAGPRRVLSLALCLDRAAWVCVRAAERLTDPAEIVMDLIDARIAQEQGGGKRGTGKTAEIEPETAPHAA